MNYEKIIFAKLNVATKCLTIDKLLMVVVVEVEFRRLFEETLKM